MSINNSVFGAAFYIIINLGYPELPQDKELSSTVSFAQVVVVEIYRFYLIQVVHVIFSFQ